jgi:hypothetical protein
MKQEFFGRNYAQDSLNVAREIVSTPKLPTELTTVVPISVSEDKDLLFYTEHILHISAVTRAVRPRVAIPILNSYNPGTATILPPYSEQLYVKTHRTLEDTSYSTEANNLLISLNVLNSEDVVDELPTIISTMIQQPFWS